MDDFNLTSQIVQYLFAGLTIGAIYGLVAIGFNIIYNVTEVINFAQGEFVVWGGLLCATFFASFGFPLLIALVFSVAAAALIGVIIYIFTIRSLKKPTILTMIMVTIAVSIILKGIAMFIWGKEPYALTPFTQAPPFKMFGAYILTQTLWVIGITLCLVLLLSAFFQGSLTGKAMRACSDNPEAAQLVGISHSLMVLLAFSLSAALGAAAGAIITPISLMEYDRGAMLALKGFGAAILGGLGNFYGAIFAGLFLGILEAFSTGMISSSYKDAIALVIILLVLFLRPEGFFKSSKHTRRA